MREDVREDVREDSELDNFKLNFVLERHLSVKSLGNILITERADIYL